MKDNEVKIRNQVRQYCREITLNLKNKRIHREKRKEKKCFGLDFNHKNWSPSPKVPLRGLFLTVFFLYLFNFTLLVISVKYKNHNILNEDDI